MQNVILARSLSIEGKPFPAKNQTLRFYRVYISPTKQASSALIQMNLGTSLRAAHSNLWCQHN